MKFGMYHTCITVLDLEKSIKFYEEALNMKPVRTIGAEDGSYRLVFLGNEDSSCQLELTWYRDREKPYDLGDNEIHIGFQTDDFDAALAHHREMGCVCFENEKLGVYFISDPDGYWMEVVPVR